MEITLGDRVRLVNIGRGDGHHYERADLINRIGVVSEYYRAHDEPPFCSVGIKFADDENYFFCQAHVIPVNEDPAPYTLKRYAQEHFNPMWLSTWADELVKAKTLGEVIDVLWEYAFEFDDMSMLIDVLSEMHDYDAPIPATGIRIPKPYHELLTQLCDLYLEEKPQWARTVKDLWTVAERKTVEQTSDVALLQSAFETISYRLFENLEWSDIPKMYLWHGFQSWLFNGAEVLLNQRREEK